MHHLLELGAGGVRIEPGLDAVAVLLDGVRADDHLLWIGGGLTADTVARHKAPPPWWMLAADGISVFRTPARWAVAERRARRTRWRIETVHAEHPR